MKASRPALLLVILGFLAVFLFYPLGYACKAAFFDWSWRVRPREVLDWQALAGKLTREPRSPAAQKVWALLAPDARTALQAAAGGAALTDEQQQAVVDSLDRSVIPDKGFYSAEAFAGVELSESARNLLRRRGLGQTASQIEALSAGIATALEAAPEKRDAAAVLAKAAALREALGSLAAQAVGAGTSGVEGALAPIQAGLEREQAGRVPTEGDFPRLAQGLRNAVSSLVSRYLFTAQDVEHLNRRLLEAAFPDALARIRFAGGHLTAEFFTYFWRDALTRQSILNSLALACMVTLLSAALALPLSMLVTRYRFPGKALLTGLLLVPMIMPPFVGAIGMRQILARFGSLNLLLMHGGLISSPVDWLGGAKFWGIVILEVLHLYPIMYLNFAAALANVDPSLEEAAVNMGSSGLRLFRRITLPLMMPGLFAGSVLVFIWALTDLGTPLVFNYRMVVPVQIFNQVNELSTNPKGYALVVGVLAMTVLMFVVAKRFFGVTAYQSLSRGRTAGSERRVGPLAGLLIVLFVGGVVALATLPHAAVILSSLRAKWFMTVLPSSYTLQHFQDALGHQLTLPSIRNSIGYSAASTVVDLFLGIVIAYLLVRHKFRGQHVLDAIVMLPLAVPGLVLAFGYVAAFTAVPADPSQGFFVRKLLAMRSALDPQHNPTALLIIAYAIRRLPYMVRAAYAGFQQVNVELEEAAINLGSPPVRAMRRVTVPLISANLIAGGILAFSFAMLEVSDSLILAMQERFYPITKTIYQLVSRIEDGPYIASALGVWAMVFLGLSLITAGVLLGRRMGQLFRA